MSLAYVSHVRRKRKCKQKWMQTSATQTKAQMQTPGIKNCPFSCTWLTVAFTLPSHVNTADANANTNASMWRVTCSPSWQNYFNCVRLSFVPWTPSIYLRLHTPQLTLCFSFTGVWWKHRPKQRCHSDPANANHSSICQNIAEDLE